MTMSTRQEFGQIVKEIRRDKHLTQKQLADALGYTEQYIRHIEAGRKPPPSDLGQRISDLTGVPDYILNRLCRNARMDNRPMLDVFSYEQKASRIRVWENRLVPGILQTEPYARAIMWSEDGVRSRMERQTILPNLRLHTVVAECVLYHEIGTPTIFREQLERLIEWRVQVVPSRGYHRGLEGPIMIMDLPDATPVAWVESQISRLGAILDTEEEVRAVADAWDDMLCHALPIDMSAEMIAAIAADLPEED